MVKFLELREAALHVFAEDEELVDLGGEGARASVRVARLSSDSRVTSLI